MAQALFNIDASPLKAALLKSETVVMVSPSMSASPFRTASSIYLNDREIWPPKSRQLIL